MDEIEVYTFEDAAGDEFGTFSTQEIDDARDYARDNGLRIIANKFCWVDSEVVADYTRANIGTPDNPSDHDEDGD